MITVTTMTTMTTSDLLAHHLREVPDVFDALDASWSGAWSVVDPCLLELCRLQVAAVLQCHEESAIRTEAAVACGFDEAKATALSEWFRSPIYSSAERACLAFTDQFVIDVANLDDGTAATVRGQLGDQGFVDFVSALLIIEQRQRLRLAWATLLDER